MNIRRGAMLAGVWCIVSVVSAQSVTSGIFGFSKVVAPAGDFKMIGTAFDVGDDGVTTLDEIFGTNGFAASSSAVNADKIYVWDKVNSEYLTAFLNDAGWGLTNPDTSEAIAFKWCYFDGVSFFPRPCASASEYGQHPGDAVYVKAIDEVEVVLSGNVPTVATIDVSIVEGFNMIAVPYPGDTVLETIISTSDGAAASSSAANADKIYLWDEVAGEYKTYFLNDDGWGATNPDTAEAIAFKWCYFDGVSFFPRPANETIVSGTGFFYFKEFTGSMTWSKDRPYEVD